MYLTADATSTKNGEATFHNRLSLNGQCRDAKAPAVVPAPLPAVGDGAETASPGASPPEGRNAAGRFKPGNKIGQGNPYARQQAALRGAITDAVTVDKIDRLTAKLLSQALAGDIQAAELLLRYAIGRPDEAPNPDTLDLEEWQALSQSPSKAQVLCAILKFVRPDLAVDAYGWAEICKQSNPEMLAALIVGDPDPHSVINPILDAKHKRP